MENSEISINERASSIEEAHSINQFEFIGHLGFSTSDEVKHAILFYEYDSIQSQGKNPIVHAVKAKILSIEGKLLNAFELFKYAHRLSIGQWDEQGDSKSSETLAYIKFEYAVFYKKIGEFEYAADLLIEAKKIATDKNLILLIEYELTLIKYNNNDKDYLEAVESFLSVIDSSGIEIAYILGLQNLGNHSLSKSEYSEARKYLSKALSRADKLSNLYLIHSINNSLGLLEIGKKNYDAALKILQEVYETASSNYIRSLAVENIALAHVLKNSKELAINYAHEALAISTENGIIDRIPAQAMFLGDVYVRKFKAPQKAGYFYQVAFDHALKFAEIGLPLSGQRMQAVEKYISFIKQHPQIKKQHSIKKDVFRFAIGKSWAEITDVFKLNLIFYHRQLHRKIAPMLKEMRLTLPQYNSKQNLLKKKGYVIPNMKFRNPKYEDPAYSLELQDYIGRMTDKSWDVALKKFEVEMMTYLYSACNYNKNTLSKALDFSYSHTLLKMKELRIPKYRR